MEEKFYLPPTIQEMERDDPENFLTLIYTTAAEILNNNMVYTGKVIRDDLYQLAFDVHVAGIKNSLRMGTAKVRGGKILFHHPGKGEFVEYDKELQDYLLGFIRKTKETIRTLQEYKAPYTGDVH